MSRSLPRPRPASTSSLGLRRALALALASPALACFSDLGLPTATDATTATGGSEATTGATTGPVAVCGDGIEQPGEQCDRGPLNDAYGDCTPECLLAVCGDGLLAPAEACDDGDADDSDACLPDCTRPRCGDGILDLDAGEQCDDGNDDDHDTCTRACQHAGCGDGVLQVDEACDHGDLNGMNAACIDCALAFCGDGLLGPGEACDPGLPDPPCSESCALATCGDDIVDPDEACQPGDKACTDRCLLNVCGDGFLHTSEACDDGNLVDGDGCSALCQSEVCGDNLQVASEGCDDANTASGDGCSSQCQRDARFIFVTSEKHSVTTLGDLATADKKCQDSADAKQLAGTYRAWLSLPGEPAAARLHKSDLPYILPGKPVKLVAADWLALTSGTLAHPINRTADGTLIAPGMTCDTPDNLAWTHTRISGGPFPGDPCDSWTSSLGTAAAGILHATNLDWTEACPEISCTQALRLYCVEQ